MSLIRDIHHLLSELGGAQLNAAAARSLALVVLRLVFDLIRSILSGTFRLKPNGRSPYPRGASPRRRRQLGRNVPGADPIDTVILR